MVGYPAVAQGTWYTSKAAWLAAVTSVRTDTFSDSLGRESILNRLGGDLKVWETGTDTEHLYGGTNNVGDRFISVSQTSKIMKLSVISFAFGCMFAVVGKLDSVFGRKFTKV